MFSSVTCSSELLEGPKKSSNKAKVYDITSKYPSSDNH